MVGRQTEELYPGESLLIPSDDGRLSTPRMGHHGPQALYPGDPESRARTPIEIAPYATHGRPIIHGSGPMTHHDLSNQNDLHPLIETPIPGSFDCIPGSEGPPEPGLCAGCGDRISDRYYLLAVGKPWHANCLRCAECKLTLDSELTCFAKDGSIYCKEDYYRRFALKRCSGCQQGISAQDLVMRARHLVYHLNCFTCAACHKMLTTGEHFGIHDNHIFCHIHYETAAQGDFILGGMPHMDYPGNDPMSQHQQQHHHQHHHIPLFNGVGVTTKGRPRKRKRHLNEFDMDPCGQMGNENDMIALCGPDSLAMQSGRQKRMRTSFKHHQLRIMKSYFQLNHNPDAKDLKQLAQKTGLSKRVLQVWFQNARAKHRRNQLKQDTEKGRSSSPGAGGTPGSTCLQHDDSDDAKTIINNNNTMDELSNAPSPAYSDNSACLSDHGSRYADYDTAITRDFMDSSLHVNSSESSALTEIFRASFTAVN